MLISQATQTVLIDQVIWACGTEASGDLTTLGKQLAKSIFDKLCIIYYNSVRSEGD